MQSLLKISTFVACHGFRTCAVQVVYLQAWAKGSSYEACVEATAGPDDGTVLRAPTEKQGLIPLCKDTFLGKV